MSIYDNNVEEGFTHRSYSQSFPEMWAKEIREEYSISSFPCPLPEPNWKPEAKAAWKMHCIGVSHPGHRAGNKWVENRFGEKQITILGPTTILEGQMEVTT